MITIFHVSCSCLQNTFVPHSCCRFMLKFKRKSFLHILPTDFGKVFQERKKSFQTWIICPFSLWDVVHQRPSTVLTVQYNIFFKDVSNLNHLSFFSQRCCSSTTLYFLKICFMKKSFQTWIMCSSCLADLFQQKFAQWGYTNMQNDLCKKYALCNKADMQNDLRKKLHLCMH